MLLKCLRLTLRNLHLCVCKTMTASICISLCVLIHAFMHVCRFINIANGFSAGPKFVCSVTEYGSRFIRQVFRIEAWLISLSLTRPSMTWHWYQLAGGDREKQREVVAKREDKRGNIYDDCSTIKAGWYFDLVKEKFQCFCRRRINSTGFPVLDMDPKKQMAFQKQQVDMTTND